MRGRKRQSIFVLQIEQIIFVMLTSKSPFLLVVEKRYKKSFLIAAHIFKLFPQLKPRLPRSSVHVLTLCSVCCILFYFYDDGKWTQLKDK